MSYSIRLIVSADEQYDWKFETLESRNTAYKKVFRKFELEKTNHVPFIEIEIDDEESNLPTVQIPLRLKVEMKSEVIDFIKSLM